MMTEEQIRLARNRLEAAFSPLICKAEDWDYKAKMRFKVLDESGNIIFSTRAIVQDDVVDAGRLGGVIEQARVAIQAQGYVLA